MNKIKDEKKEVKEKVVKREDITKDRKKILNKRKFNLEKEIEESQKYRRIRLNSDPEVNLGVLVEPKTVRQSSFIFPYTHLYTHQDFTKFTVKRKDNATYIKKKKESTLFLKMQ